MYPCVLFTNPEHLLYISFIFSGEYTCEAYTPYHSNSMTYTLLDPEFVGRTTKKIYITSKSPPRKASVLYSKDPIAPATSDPGVTVGDPDQEKQTGGASSRFSFAILFLYFVCYVFILI